MIWAFLCGLLFGGLLYGTRRQEVRRRRSERMYDQIRDWWYAANQLEDDSSTADLCRAGYVDAAGIPHFYDGEF